MRCRIKRQLTSVGRIGENSIRFGKENGARSKPMTTASIPELRKAHARTRAQLARAAVRYDKRALTSRGSGEDGPPSDQEVALLRELLAAAVMATTATALGGCRRSQPRSTVGVVVGGVPAGHGPGCWGSGGDHRAGKALQEAAIVVCERGPHRLRPGRQGG